MRILLLCGDAPNQRALANRLADIAPVAAIGIIDHPRPKKRPPLGSQLALRTIGRPLRSAWFGMLAHYSKCYPTFPNGPTISRHSGVNAPSVLELVRTLQPELVLVSGTDLLRRPLIEVIAASGKVMNLHTGLSPFIRGGPNCTNWALALRRFDLIGNTIMWLDAGIDSGNIIAAEATVLTGDETLKELHVAVMDHAHALYCQCVRRFAEGDPLPSISQASMGPGRLFLREHWTTKQIIRALINFKLHFRLDCGASSSSSEARDVAARAR